MGSTRARSAYAAIAVVLGLLVAAPRAARASAGGPPTPPATATEVVAATGWYTADDACTITLYAPTTPGLHPAVVFVHGGAWGRSQPNDYELQWARDLAQDEGWLVAVIGYPTKVPRSHVVEPRAVADAVDAVAQRSDVDPQAVAVWGESAGGHLALLAGYRDAARLHPRVTAVVSISGPTDMTAEFFSAAQTALGAVTRFEGLTPREASRTNSARYRTTSPVHLVEPNSPATFQAVSRHDRLVPAGQVDRLTRLLAAARVTHRTFLLPGRAHSSGLETVRPPGSPQTIQQHAIAFLEEVFDAERVAFG